MPAATINGERTQSVTLNHIISYPLVNDITHIYQENPLGAKSISLARSAYDTFAVPVIPYLQTPYSYVHPYVAKADSLGDSTLTSVDNHFPALKTTDLDSLKSNASAAAHFPFKVAGDGYEYVVNTYDDEYKKVGGQGITTTGKAVISTELRIASESLHAVADWVGPKKQQVEEELEKLRQKGVEKANKTKKAGQEKYEHLTNSN